MVEQASSGKSASFAVCEVKVAWDAAALCGPGFAPVASAPLPDHVLVFRVGDRAGREVVNSSWCYDTEARRDRWDAAERNYLDAVSRALVVLHQAHGGQRVSVDLHGGSPSRAVNRWPYAPQRWTAAKSAKAQRAFLARLDRASEAYRLVREEITLSLASSEGRLQAAKREEGQQASPPARAGTTVFTGTDGFAVWFAGLDPA